jgi:hypothetical protein
MSQNVEITFNLIIAAPGRPQWVLRFVTLLLSGSVK